MSFKIKYKCVERCTDCQVKTVRKSVFPTQCKRNSWNTKDTWWRSLRPLWQLVTSYRPSGSGCGVLSPVSNNKTRPLGKRDLEFVKTILTRLMRIQFHAESFAVWNNPTVVWSRMALFLWYIKDWLRNRYLQVCFWQTTIVHDLLFLLF